MGYMLATGFMVIITGILFFFTFKSVVRKLKSKNKVKIYSFRRRPLAQYTIVWLINAQQVYFKFRNLKTSYEFGEYNVKIENILDYVNTKDIYYKTMFICFIVIGILCLIDIVLSLIFPSSIYSDGIMVRNGKFIPWQDIKKVEYRSTIMEYSYIVEIYTSDKKFEIVYVKKADIKKALDIIYENINVNIYKVTTGFD